MDKYHKIGSVVALLTFCTVASGAPNSIVPGRSIGRVQLGHDTTAALGAPTTADAAMGRESLSWITRQHAADGHVRPYQLDVWRVRMEDGHTKRVEEIRINSPWFTTRNGISTRSSYTRIRRAFPHLRMTGYWTLHADPSQRIDVYQDARRGIGFEFRRRPGHTSAAARCTAIFVDWPASEPYNVGLNFPMSGEQQYWDYHSCLKTPDEVRN